MMEIIGSKQPCLWSNFPLGAKVVVNWYPNPCVLKDEDDNSATNEKHSQHVLNSTEDICILSPCALYRTNTKLNLYKVLTEESG